MIFKKLCRGRIATFCPRWHFDIVDEPLSRTRSTLVPLEYSPKTLLSSSFVGQSLERKTLFPGHFLLLPTYNLPFSGLMNHGVLRSMSAYMVWRLQSNSTSLINWDCGAKKCRHGFQRHLRTWDRRWYFYNVSTTQATVALGHSIAKKISWNIFQRSCTSASYVQNGSSLQKFRLRFSK